MAGASPLPPTPPSQQQQKAVAMNALRLLAIGDRLRAHFRGGATVLEPADLAHLVYAFARGIDFALSSGDVPIVAGDIPSILKKVYLIGNDQFLQSSAMVLMISCKNACSQNWFQPTDCTDILKMANELSGNFCTPVSEPDNDSTVIQIISTIIPRYYPQLKFERLVTSLEAKVGYDVLMADFFIHKSVPREEKINLIVVQKEDLDSSSCIANPPHVSFLVNGKGVDKRTNVSMETGPLFPSDITRMLKYGANIIQAIGYFNANYIIAVAFLNKLESLDTPNLNDYAQPIAADPPDSDILEGPSRVSLKCPISFRRIKIPIKGRLCKHYQCFDYDNYMEMNLRKPTWRCPCCNTPSNFTDLRIDQKMAKILQETGEDTITIDVLVFSDGSWKAISTYDERSDRHFSDIIQQSGDTMDTDVTPDDVIDLINEDDDGDALMSFAPASEDVKPFLNCQDLSVADYLSDVPMNTVSQAEDLHAGGGNNERGNVTSTSGQNSSLPSTGGQGSSSFGTLESILPRNILHPVITDAVSPSLDTSNSVVPRQNGAQGTHSDIVRLQPWRDPLLGLEIARPPIPRNVRRDPIGIQALPVQPQRVQPNIYNCPPPFPQSSPVSKVYQAHHVTNSDTVITAINNGVGSLSRAPDATSLLQRQSTQQDMRNTQNYHQAIIGITAPQNFMGTRPPPGGSGQAIGANAHGASPAQQSHHIDRLLANNLLNQLGQAAAAQASTAPQVLPAQSGSASTISPKIRSHFFPAQRSQAMRTPQAAPRPTISKAPSRLQSPFSPTTARPGTPSPIGTSDDLPELPVDESWRPSGQMRGSLTGEAYSVAIGRYAPNVNITGQQTSVVTSQARPAGLDARK